MRSDNQCLVDVGCTIVSRGSLRELLRAARARAHACGGSIDAQVVTDRFSEPFDADQDEPQETLGSLTYTAGTARRALFWSSVARDGLVRVSVGIYIGEFAGERGEAEDPCALALDDMLRLFGGEATLCVALALEDDREFDVGPGLVGCYRAWLWRELAVGRRPGLALRQRDDDWLEVRPRAGARLDALAVQSAMTRWIAQSQQSDSSDPQAIFADLAADLLAERPYERLLVRLFARAAGEWHDLGELCSDEPELAGRVAAVGGPVLVFWQALPMSLHGDGYCTVALYAEAEHLHSLALYDPRRLRTLRLV